MELGHDMVNPLLEECPGGGEVCRRWWHRKLGYGSHEKGWKGMTKRGVVAVAGRVGASGTNRVSNRNASFSRFLSFVFQKSTTIPPFISLILHSLEIRLTQGAASPYELLD